jgi:hypothetical protein
MLRSIDVLSGIDVGASTRGVLDVARKRIELAMRLTFGLARDPMMPS